MDENQAVGGNVTFDPIEFFPMEEAREKQVKALDFVKRAVEQGYAISRIFDTRRVKEVLLPKE